MKIEKHKIKPNHWWKYIIPRRITLKVNPPIYKWLWFIFRYSKEEWQEKLHRRGQNTFIYCPKCGAELISTNSFVKDTDLVYYKCKCCGLETSWDFDVPAPILIKKEN